MELARDGHGTLNWLVMYQSLDGRLMLVYCEDEREVSKRVDHLAGVCGRQVTVWRLCALGEEAK